MGRGIVERYAGGDSPAHRLDPRAKIVLVVAFVVTVVSTPPPQVTAFVAYAGLVACACAWARIPVLAVVLRALCVLPFALLASCWMPFVAGGERVAVLGGRLELSLPGLWVLAGVVMKSQLGAAATIWLIGTTPFATLLAGLRRLGAPVIVVDLLALMYRYIHVLVDEARHLRLAAASRGYRPRWLGQAWLIGRLVGRLFVRSYERAERVYDAMVLRGFTGRLPASRPLRFRLADAAALGLLLPAFVAARVFLR